MHGSHADFLAGISGFLGGYYLCLSIMNAVMAFYLWHNRNKIGAAIFWTAVSLLLVGVASAAMGGSPLPLPQSLRDQVNAATGPVIYSVGTTALLAVFYFAADSSSNRWLPGAGLTWRWC